MPDIEICVKASFASNELTEEVTCGIGAGGAAINHLVMDTTLVMGAVMMLYAEIVGCVTFSWYGTLNLLKS